uniref:Uncharacterized protein n=1 Tax=Physcomitrium patens TaxID=3218 RepID=A0A2K1I9M1_PHYPA|nr:hypothetical protein PHYPA_031251 [Physcomitrium patens]
MLQHAQVEVQASQVPVRCPQSDCSEELEYSHECKHNPTMEVFVMRTKQLTKASVPEGDEAYCLYAKYALLLMD